MAAELTDAVLHADEQVMDLLSTDPWQMDLWRDSSRASPSVSLPPGFGPDSRRSSMRAGQGVLPSKPSSERADGGPLAQFRLSLGLQGGESYQPNPKLLTIQSCDGESPRAGQASDVADPGDLPPGEPLAANADSASQAATQPQAPSQAAHKPAKSWQLTGSQPAAPATDASDLPDMPGTPDTPSEQILETVHSSLADLSSPWGREIQRAAELRAASQSAWEQAQRLMQRARQVVSLSPSITQAVSPPLCHPIAL